MWEQTENAPKPIKKILVIRQGALGDFILTLPVFQSLKKTFPRAELWALGNPPIARLAGECLSGIIPHDQPGLHTLYSRECCLPGSLAAIFQEFNLAISFSPDPEGILGENLKRLGIPWVINGGGSASDPPLLPMTERLLLPLKQAGLPVTAEPPCVRPAPIDRAGAQRFFGLPKPPGKPEGLVVAIHPGSGGSKKCWPADHFVSIIRWLKSAFAARIVLLAGPADDGVMGKILPQVKTCRPLLAHQLPLTQVAAILECCSLFLGNDSGVTHLAAAVGIPTLALFGPTDCRIWAPRNPRVQCLQALSPCAPCSSSIMARCDQAICMDSLPVETIQPALTRLLVRFSNQPERSEPYPRRKVSHVSR